MDVARLTDSNRIVVSPKLPILLLSLIDLTAILLLSVYVWICLLKCVAAGGVKVHSSFSLVSPRHSDFIQTSSQLLAMMILLGADAATIF
jgi:hypothetical protein